MHGHGEIFSSVLNCANNMGVFSRSVHRPDIYVQQSHTTDWGEGVILDPGSANRLTSHSCQFWAAAGSTTECGANPPAPRNPRPSLPNGGARRPVLATVDLNPGRLLCLWGGFPRGPTPPARQRETKKWARPHPRPVPSPAKTTLGRGKPRRAAAPLPGGAARRLHSSGVRLRGCPRETRGVVWRGLAAFEPPPGRR